MRRFLFILGMISLAVIVIVAAGLGVAFWKGNALDAESKAFVDTLVPAIAANWDSKALLQHASTEFIESAPPEKLSEAFSQFSRLGRMLNYEGSSGDSKMFYSTSAGNTITAQYAAKARFENGEAMFQLSLVKRGQQWQVIRLNVSPVGKVLSAHQAA
jgi:hypothetical protein